MKNKGTILLLLFGVVAALILFLAGFIPRYLEMRELYASYRKQNVLQVRVLKVKRDLAKETLILPSSAVPFHSTPIWARVDGYLSDYYVDIGDTVAMGQLLSLIDTPELDAQLDQAKGELADFTAQREIAQITANRWEGLYIDDAGATTKQDVDERNFAYKSAQAEVIAAGANVRRLESLQNFQNIIAPFDGIIIERDIDIGSLITAGSSNSPQQLFVIADIDIIRMFVDVPQYYYRAIQVGETVEVTISEFQNRTFKGTVVRTANALDPIARTLLTEIYIDNDDKEIFPGLYAEVKFILDPTAVSFTLPTEALIIRSGPPQVAIVNQDMTIEFRTVAIGLDNGSSIEIVGGLKEGDTVVINPNERIKPGARVQIAT